MSLFSPITNFFRELSDTLSLFSGKNASLRRLVFYSESDIYYQYYEDVIASISSESDLEICYITSDPEDSIFKRNIPRLKTFYINNLLPFAMIYFDSAAFVMTMPDLGNFHIKRSINEVNYIYAFHAIGSTHLMSKKGAFDHYDTILCIGTYHPEEIRAAEKKYGTKAKTLIECGYPRLDKIYRDHEKLEAEKSGCDAQTKKILIAPTWSPGNILDSCIFEIVDSLAADKNFCVAIRPHPEYKKRFPHRVKAIGEKIKDFPQFSLELDMLSEKSLHEADVLITDWSAISFEYALGTGRPVLFIDTPMRVDNPDYAELGIEPVEFSARKNLGIALPPEKAGEIGETVGKLIAGRLEFRSKIEEYRKTLVYNFGSSAAIAARVIIDAAQKGVRSIAG